MDQPLPDPLSLVGVTLADKYRIERLVAEGGFSFVYRATHTGWNQPCVLKFLKGLGSAEHRERLVASLVQEGALLRELSSRAASILQAHDIGTWHAPSGTSYPYLVLEWLDGATLAEVIERERESSNRPLSLTEAVELFDPVARALAAAHRRGVAHRDLKPENLFLCGDLHSHDAYIKVLDFGVAKILDDAGARAEASRQTGRSQAAFTPWYGAPEQFQNNYGPTGPWTDVFALALVLLEVMTFQRALSGDDMLALAIESIHPSQRPTPRNKGVPVSDEVEAVFSRAVSVQPSARYQNATDFWADLRRVMGLDLGDLGTTFNSRSGGAGPLSARPPQNATLQAPPETPSLINFPSVSQPPSAPPPAPFPQGPTLSSDPSPPSRRNPPWLWGLVAGSALVVVGGSALLLGMRMQSQRMTPPTPSAASAAAMPLPPPPPPPACAADMVKIPGGNFYMGFDGDEAMESEQPQHPVKLGTFCIDVTEVTVEAYRSCSDQGRCLRAGGTVKWPTITAQQKKVYGPLCNINNPGRDRHPINCVTWEMADTYCKQKGKRLPTSAEWEYAVRGPDGRTYPWGDEPPDANRLNACGKECIEWGKKNGIFDLVPMHKEDDSFPTTAPVGSFPKGRSRYGLDDVIGNVMEWVYDWDGPYDKAAQTDPKGPASGTERVIRGGAWNAGHMVWVRPSFRFKFPPDVTSHGIGFRCASDFPEAAAAASAAPPASAP